ncbi:MAG: DNA recombination protein RmuC [Lutibacter sp.]|nr:DNA recombination protein RmuC [Lutibacter sp.]
MDNNIIILLATLIIGFIIGYLISKLKSKQQITTLEERIRSSNELKIELDTIRKEKGGLLIELTEKSSEIKYLEEKLSSNKSEIEKLQKTFRDEFKNLANEILEEKTLKFTEQNKENLKTILNPLQEKIQNFEKKVEDTHKESIDYHAALRQQILGLKELNVQMSKETLNLTKALKGDSKTQGDWGETQLEVLLERANLTKNIHYSTQGGYRDETGILKKPDFIINLPDNKHLIIDAKVSLTAYESYYNAETDLDKATHLKKHLTSIKKHFKELGEKQYQELYEMNTPDYVLMFVPVEPALMIALNEDNSLYLEALDKNVVLVSTSTLLATLSTVSSIWKQEDQKKNVLEIAKRAGALYDKFEGFVQDLLKVGKSINTSKDSYDAAMNKLVEGKGNLVTSIEKIKKLGAKAKKALPQSIIERAEEN